VPSTRITPKELAELERLVADASTPPAMLAAAAVRALPRLLARMRELESEHAQAAPKLGDYIHRWRNDSDPSGVLSASLRRVLVANGWKLSSDETGLRVVAGEMAKD